MVYAVCHHSLYYVICTFKHFKEQKNKQSNKVISENFMLSLEQLGPIKCTSYQGNCLFLKLDVVYIRMSILAASVFGITVRIEKFSFILHKKIWLVLSTRAYVCNMHVHIFTYIFTHVCACVFGHTNVRMIVLPSICFFSNMVLSIYIVFVIMYFHLFKLHLNTIFFSRCGHRFI